MEIMKTGEIKEEDTYLFTSNNKETTWIVANILKNTALNKQNILAGQRPLPIERMCKSTL